MQKTTDFNFKPATQLEDIASVESDLWLLDLWSKKQFDLLIAAKIKDILFSSRGSSLPWICPYFCVEVL